MRICKLIYYLKSNQIKPGPERQIRILGSASRRKGFTPGSRLAVCDVRARERRKMSHPVDARHPRRGQAGGALNGSPPHRQAPVPGLLPPRLGWGCALPASGPARIRDTSPPPRRARPETAGSGTRGAGQLPRRFLGRD